MIQIRRVPSFIGWTNWAIKQIATCKDSKNTVRIQPLSFFTKLCYVDKIKCFITDKSFFFAVTMGPKISETIKGKLSFGAKVLQAGGIDKVFREYFAVEKDEKLRKAFQCYLSTTAGPIAGMLFISTKKIAFHSDRPLSFTSPKGGSTRVPYKVIEAKSLRQYAYLKFIRYKMWPKDVGQS